MNEIDQKGFMKRAVAILPQLAMAAIYALACSVLLLRLMDLSMTVTTLAFSVVIGLGVFTMTTWTRYQVVIFLSISAILVIIIFLFKSLLFPEDTLSRFFDSLGNWFRWVINDFARGQTGLPNQRFLLGLVIASLITLFAYLTIARFSHPLLSGAFWSVLFFFSWSREPLFVWGWSLPAVSMSILSAVKNQKQIKRLLKKEWQITAVRLIRQSVPLTTAVVIASFLLTTALPVSWFHSYRLENAVDRIVRRVSGIQWENDVSDSFSIQAAGFYPLRDRLGGPVNLSDQPVLRISSTGDSMLLKGAVRQTYDGKSWYSDPNAIRYRFDSPLWENEQTEVFDLKRPDLQSAGIEAAAFHETRVYTWSPIGLPTRVVFAAGKPLHLSWSDTEPLQISFTLSGELFSDYWIRPDQSVLMSCRTVRTNTPRFPDQVQRIQNTLDADAESFPEDIKQRYLQLPDLMIYQQRGDLRQWVLEMTDREETPYGKAKRLQDHLMTQYTYQLDVSIPPREAEFVSWFMQTGSGYCVYFATAMTMFARLAGIPARYVEGYVVPASPEGNQMTEHLITGQQAHAWTEIYLAGIGWIPIDATPGGPRFNPVTPPAQPTRQPIETSQPDISITPLPTEHDPDQGTSDPDQKQSRQTGSLILSALLLIFLASLVGWLMVKISCRKHRHQIDWVRRRLPDARDQVQFYWSESRHLLEAMGLIRKNPQSAPAFLRELAKTEGLMADIKERIQAASASLELTLYANWIPEDSAVENWAEIYDFLEKQLVKKRGWLISLITTLNRRL